MRNREKQRELKKLQSREERLNSKTEWGTNDPVPQGAVNNIISERRYKHEQNKNRLVYSHS